MSPQTGYRIALVMSAIGAALTVPSLLAMMQLGSVNVAWLPCGAIVTAFFFARRRFWLKLGLFNFVMQFIVLWMSGLSPYLCMIYVTGAVSEAVLCAWIAMLFIKDPTRLPRSFREISGLFLAATIASTAGSLFGIGLRDDFFSIHLIRVILSNIAGLLIVPPILISLVSRFVAHPEGERDHFTASLVWTMSGFAVLTYLALSVSATLMLPIFMSSLVFICVHHGQLGTGFAALIVVTVGTVISIGGASPFPMNGQTQLLDTIALQTWIVAILVSNLPIGAMQLKRAELRGALEDRNSRLHESVTIFGLAEQVSGVGRWRLDLQTGAQDWSPLLLEMHGLSRDLGPDPGDMRGLLSDGGSELYRQIDENDEAVLPYSFNYTIKPLNEPERILRMSILNEFDRGGKRVGVFGVAVDVTEQIRREQALDLARGRAVRLAAEAQQLANTDALTSLPNRRCTFERLESLIANSNRRQIALAAVMFDIDHFKRINDTFGHQTGDEVIVQVAEIARRQTRQGDLVGRVGGEEFVWLLPHMGPEQARKAAERLRAEVERATEESEVPPVTISLGLAAFRAGDTAETLLARADAALYEAKEGGRNMVRRAA